ncbi:Ribosomal protein S18 acetylase RimI [Williamsia sterculiae]|uniref:Ribosomal protein S18 acetylase RimI n=2 Tax=Williamsia sterculiae TaxID=1344003 RepID=A0A1N7FVN6_9NOCA|nr:Ribosomal protein S18 acetylase RimI [Williamsia sterculiae]
MPAPRVASPADADGIVALRDDSARWMLSRGNTGQWQPGEITAADIADQAARGEWHVGEVDGEIVTAVRLIDTDPDFWGVDDRAGYVHGLMVDRRFAGHGWGEQLLAWCAPQARARGHDRLRLDCVAGNRRLREFYALQGFREVGESVLPAQFRHREVVAITLLELLLI